ITLGIVALLAMTLVGGILYALSRSAFGRLILLGAVCWLIWFCWSGQPSQTHPASVPIQTVQPHPASAPLPGPDWPLLGQGEVVSPSYAIWAQLPNGTPYCQTMADGTVKHYQKGYGK